MFISAEKVYDLSEQELKELKRKKAEEHEDVIWDDENERVVVKGGDNE